MDKLIIALALWFCVSYFGRSKKKYEDDNDGWD